MGQTRSFDLFCESSLLKGFKEEEKNLLFSMSREVNLEPGEHLLEEGDVADQLYIVIEGTLEVLKHDRATQTNYPLSKVGPGDTLGEVSLLDHGRRAASIKALSSCTLRSISFDELRNSLSKNKELGAIFFRLSENIGQKLRSSNEFALQSLKKELEASQIRTKMGMLIIGIIIFLTSFMYVMIWLKTIINEVPNTSYISVPLTFGFGLSIFIFLKYFKLSFYEMGITTVNWKKSLFEGLFVTGLLAAIFFPVFKWFLIKYVPHYAGRPIFEPFELIQDPSHRNWGYWLKLNLMYVFVTIPVQELVCRGGIQGILEKFLTGKHRVILSILASNLMFGSTHAFLAPYISITVFISGCYMGMIYHRTHNLLASYCAHVVVGLSALSIFGIVSGIFD
jgi:CRP/FNR family cyclic AMP-dependent transcriptional regulator